MLNYQNMLIYSKDYIFQNIVCFVFLLVIIYKLDITLKYIYTFMIVVVLWYIYFNITNDDNKIDSEKKSYVLKFIKGNNYYDKHNDFINFINNNKRFEESKSFGALINIINTFLKFYSELINYFEVQKMDNCYDLYKNALNTYQSLIYLISTIDNDYEDNLKKLKNIFNIYLSNLKDIEKDNSNQLTRDSRPYQEVNVEGKDKLGVFDFF